MAERTETEDRIRKKETVTTRETMRTEPVSGERTTRQGAAIGTETTTPVGPYGTADERAVRHARDPSIHEDWETQPQINAPRDVGIPTSEGQADAARIRAGERRSDVAEEPRIDRRGGDVDVPLASGARRSTTDTLDDRSLTEKARDKARDVKNDVDRTI